jgi:REP element-mobilizing transposase RayT
LTSPIDFCNDAIMPRLPRIDAPGVIHHVMIRGIERRDIFQDKSDYADFLERLESLIPQTQTCCYAWVLMTNHAHFLFRSGPSGLPHLMRRLLTGYVVRFNLRHHRHGQLFQNRYKSIVCQEDAYLKDLVRYIHLNPLRAKIVEGLAGLKKYAYSGHRVLLGAGKCSWQDGRYVLKQFGKGTTTARRHYLAFVEAGLDQGHREDLTGGGLIRSLGGWSEVMRLGGRRGDRLKGDERILGDTEFVLRILEQAEEQLERRYELARRGWNETKVARQVAAIYGIAPEEIFRKGQQGSLSEARGLFCYWCSRELGLSLTALARMLSMTPAGVGYAARRGERIAGEKRLLIGNLI